MCGIAGFFGKKPVSQDKITNTLDAMKNRGPDHRSYEVIKSGENYAALLHSRLSIIDLDPRSNQPFTIGDCTLIYNGEIYNYVELKKQLEAKGVQFRTESDTEVLLQLYLQHGPKFVEQMEGMWSFALFDRRSGELILSRDRFAEKPLYYYEAPEGIYFGSEIKFLKALAGRSFTVNEQQLLRYLVNGYKALYKKPETYFKEVKEVSYATNMTIGRDLKVRNQQYWKPQYRPRPMSLEEAIEGTRKHLFESIRIRLRADVPLAFCLSGGVDSSAIASIASKKFGCDVATYSIIDSDERYNEYDNIKATVDDLGCKNHVIHLKPEPTLDRLEQIIGYHDAPIATITYYIHSYLSEAISKDGCKVVFSGTAADELFTGYYDHFNLHLYEVRNHPEYKKYLKDWEVHTGTWVRNPFLKNPELYFKNPKFRDHIYLNNDEFATYLTVDFQEQFIEEDYSESPLRNRMMNEIFHEATRVILHEDDLNSMRFSLENRSPYLDSRLFDFAYSVPPEHLMRDGYAKYLLRESVKGVLNDKVRLDRQKKGFNASIHSVLDFNSPKVRERLLDNGRVFDFFKRDRVEELLSKPVLSNSYNKFFFNYINTKLFLEQHG